MNRSPLAGHIVMRRLGTACLVVLGALTAASAVAQEAPRVLTADEAREVVEAHNTARARFGASPLEWAEGLAQQALRCIGENAGRPFQHCRSGYGENMAGTTAAMSMARAVQMWMDEEPLYDAARRRCLDFACGHFTQVVWPTTERVGCAVGPGDSGGWTNLICNYDPPGNYGFWGDDAGHESDDGSWYYFDPPPFGDVGVPGRVTPSRLLPG